MAIESEDLPSNLMGFVTDPVSGHVIMNVIKDMNMAYSRSVTGTPGDAVEFLKNNRTPKILIIDVSNSELPLADLNKIKEYSSPNVNMIVIGSRNDVGLFRDFMTVGICDYLVKPITTALLKKTIEEINAPRKPGVYEKTGKLIQFIASVGGAGSTTASTNIAWILANRHFKRTVVLDLDFLFGSANLMLDIKAENSYLDTLESPEKIDEYFIETNMKKHGKRLYYIGGLADLVRGVSVDMESFSAFVELVKKQFNYILVDSPRDVGGVAHVAMKKTDMLVIMVEMSVASAQNTARLLEFFNTDQPGKKIIIVANKLGLSSGGAIARESFEKVIDRKIDYMMPLDEGVALAAANIGQPLVLSDSPLTETLESIADDILGKKDTVALLAAILEKERSFFEKLKEKVFDVFRKNK
ncbi:MAG: AAA family ATPase [Holosporaceae bacterium]|jgi:pilus assembly protein CpaE|nr:AAA family ATPase [Holosporaceae bacterium]